MINFRRKKKFAQLEQREQAATFLSGIHHGQDAEIFFIHQPQRFRRRRVGTHAQDFPLHHVGNLRRNVGDEFWRGHAKGVQHEINPVVGVTTARGDGLGHAGAALEFRVADGGANRVRVGVAVADDKYFAHVVIA